MAEAYKINFYPKPVPPAKPRMKSFDEIQILLAKSIAKPYRDNIAAIVLFYTPSSKTTKAIFEDYAGELTHKEYKDFITKLKKHKFSHLVFALRYAYGIEYHL